VYLLILCLFFSQVNYAQSVRLTDTSYVTLGNSASLHLTNFTIEGWVKIEGYGSTTETGSTGSGGQKGLVPIITRGRGEAESPAVDINYFLGYRLSDMKLVADFEDNTSSLNHSVVSAVTLPMNMWIHVGASFNIATQTWKLFVGTGVETFVLTGGPFTPQSATNIAACIGSSLNAGTAIRAGFFNGRIDEVRIWNIALTRLDAGELTSGTGLVGRWGFNEGTGTVVSNSVSGGAAGTFSPVNPAWVPGFNQGDTTSNASVHFNGAHDYITFGAAPVLNTSAPAASGFTLEAWIKIEGNGQTTSTGTGGLSSAIPIIAKGRGESDASGLNMNYFLGLSTTDALVADFEEAAGSNTGLNHPINGGANAVIPRNVWTHVAVTYSISSGVWVLYKNGINVATLDLADGIVPENMSKQYASVASALSSTGAPQGYFNGKIDEVRIWNRPLSPGEISANMYLQLTMGTGLLGRWGLNENGNIVAGNSVGGSPTGTLRSDNISTYPSNGGPSWSIDVPNSATGTINKPPGQPTSPSPANNGSASSLNTSSCAIVSDPDGGKLRVRFYGRKKQSGAKFTIIGLPDTQFYTEEPQGANSAGGGNNGIFKAQTQWIANHRLDSSIVFVVQLGDCVQNGDNPPVADKQIEWKRADTAMKNIESPNVPLMDGIPYSVCVGNHDQTVKGDPNGTTTYYNQYFGSSRFTGRGYYGGHYKANNDNHFEIFTASGVDFIHISLEYNNYSNATEQATLQPVLNWADSLLKVYKTRKAILSTHNLLTTGNPAAFQGPGQKIYDDLKDNPNLFLMLAGHVAGEGRRTDVFNGNTVYTIMSDYQSGYTKGGNGYLRIMQFKPSESLLSVKTYSPYSNTFLTTTSSDFSLPVAFGAPFAMLGELNNVASGSTACINWPTLDPSSAYEWYVEIYDGVTTVTGPVWTFTAPAAPQFITKNKNDRLEQTKSRQSSPGEKITTEAVKR
ncbi:MAG TPA: LamG-like jellyroll fold domain-containing protein, partial [Chitinophagaceae bacterium]